MSEEKRNKTPWWQIISALATAGAFIVMAISVCQTNRSINQVESGLAKTDTSLSYLRKDYQRRRPYLNVYPQGGLGFIRFMSDKSGGNIDSIGTKGKLILENTSDYPAERVYFRSTCTAIDNESNFRVLIEKFQNEVPEYFHLAPGERDDNYSFKLNVPLAIKDKFSLFFLTKFSFEDRIFFYVVHAHVSDLPTLSKDSFLIIREFDLEVTNLGDEKVIDSLVVLLGLK